MATRRPACASLRFALPATLALLLAPATFGCSETEAPTAAEAPVASDADAVLSGTVVPPLLVTPSFTCDNGQTYVNLCLNPQTSSQTVAVPLQAARELVSQGAWIGPCPGDSPINPCQHQ